MLISIKSDHSQEHVRQAVHEWFRPSRFNIGEILLQGKTVLNIKMIRLKEKKRYCGNHPNACDIEGGRMGNYLEGVDWVEFNDRLNDVCDALQVSAFIRSDRVVIIRKGRERRVNYDSHILPRAFGQQFDWDYDAPECDFEDYCGRIAPASEYPYGTPGTYERTVASVGI